MFYTKLAAGIGLSLVLLLCAKPRVDIAPVVLQVVEETYDAFPGEEQAFCLYGAVADSLEIRVEGLVASDLAFKDENSLVVAKACGEAPWGNSQYLGLLHTHHSADKPISVVPILMQKPEQIGLACSHYVVLNSGDASRMATNDLQAFQEDSTAVISIIYCGKKLAYITRELDSAGYNIEHVIGLK